MSKERLTASEMLKKYKELFQEYPFEEMYYKDTDAIMFCMEAFAAQEVEAAIAETKKQRDELLNTLIDIRNKLYLTEKNGDICFEIAASAISNAQTE
jgi:hypothetical protein